MLLLRHAWKNEMKKLFNLLQFTQRHSQQSVPLLMVLFCIPLVVLLVFGLIAIYQLGYLLYFIMLLSGISLAYFLILLRFNKQHKASMNKDATPIVNPNSDWSEFDLQVWSEVNINIDQLLKQEDSWEVLREHALALVSATALHYRSNTTFGELAITLPEFLTMTEEVSRRYRIILLEHLPFAEHLHISRLKQLYHLRDKTDQIEQIWTAYRTLRLFTPTGIISEIRSQITSHLLDEVKDELALNLKKAFLQEVASVAIDLYSGRFQYPLGSPEEPGTVDASLPPLKICLIGQINAGKSTLANLLLKEIMAESSALASTSEKHVYELKIEGKTLIHLIDLPGFDDCESRTQMLLEECVHADMIIWLLKANQPARALDAAFKQALDQRFDDEAMRSRKKPPIIGLLTHIDQLPLLRKELPTNYTLSPKTKAEQQLVEAINYNQSLLGFSPILPICSANNQEVWGLNLVLETLDQQYQQARQTQLNRLKLAKNAKLSLSKELKRLYRIGGSLFKHWQGNTKTKH